MSCLASGSRSPILRLLLGYVDFHSSRQHFEQRVQIPAGTPGGFKNKVCSARFRAAAEKAEPVEGAG